MNKQLLHVKKWFATAGHVSSKLFERRTIATPEKGMRNIGVYALRLTGYLLAVAATYLILRSDIAYPDRIILVAGFAMLAAGVISGVYFSAAIILLVYVPILQFTDHLDASNNFAVYAFYSLCFGVVDLFLRTTATDTDEESDS